MGFKSPSGLLLLGRAAGPWMQLWWEGWHRAVPWAKGGLWHLDVWHTEQRLTGRLTWGGLGHLGTLMGLWHVQVSRLSPGPAGSIPFGLAHHGLLRATWGSDFPSVCCLGMAYLTGRVKGFQGHPGWPQVGSPRCSPSSPGGMWCFGNGRGRCIHGVCRDGARSSQVSASLLQMGGEQATFVGFSAPSPCCCQG